MTSILPRFTNGPRTYTAGEAITGGQLVEARAGEVIGVAGDGSAKVLGVAQKDAVTATQVGVGRTVDGNNTLDTTLKPSEVAVFNVGEVPVTYSVAAAFGDALVAGAAGTVRPYDSVGGDTPDLIVARCTELAGVAQNETGLARFPF